MPYPNEHSARVMNPDLFINSTFRRKKIDKGVSVILGKLKNNKTDKMKVQAYRFNKQVFTPFQAKQWLKNNKIKYIKFEAAEKKITKGYQPFKEAFGMEKIVSIKKIDEYKKMVSCIVLEPTDPDNTDLQGDFYTEEDIEKAMLSFVENGMMLNEMHEKDKIYKNSDVLLAENYIAPVDFDGIKKGSWIQSYKIKNDEVWEKILNGEITGVSIEGVGKRKEV